MDESRVDRLVLIDGNAILHRAFHALPPFTTPDGTLVNAVYGFTSMLLKIVNDLKPTHIAVAFDRPAPTFRKELFKEYQAKRPEMDETLVPQIGLVHELLTAFGIGVFEKDGFEADDVLGSLVKQATDQHLIEKPEQHMMRSGVNHVLKSRVNLPTQVIIVTGDRDLLQLVDDDKVKVYMPMKGLSEAKLFGEPETKERLGVEPKQIPDYKALAGDPSDNYPGIPGIGPKTAADLLAEFGTIENLLKAVKENSSRFKKLPQGVQEKLKSGVESAVMSHELAKVRTDVPLEVDFDKIQIKSLDSPKARKELEKLSFKSLLKRLSNEFQNKTSVKREKDKRGKIDGNQLSLV